VGWGQSLSDVDSFFRYQIAPALQAFLGSE